MSGISLEAKLFHIRVFNQKSAIVSVQGLLLPFEWALRAALWIELSEASNAARYSASEAASIPDFNNAPASTKNGIGTILS